MEISKTDVNSFPRARSSRKWGREQKLVITGEEEGRDGKDHGVCGHAFPLPPSPSPFHVKFALAAPFSAITRSETLATRTKVLLACENRRLFHYIYIYIYMLHKKTVLVKKRHFYVKKLLFYKLNGCKNTAFLQKYSFVKKQLFYVTKLLFYKLPGCKNTAFFTKIYFCKKAAFLQVNRL